MNWKDALGLAAVILAVCLGIGGCNYLWDVGAGNRSKLEAEATAINKRP